MSEDPKTQPHAEPGAALVVVSTAYTELRKLNSLPLACRRKSATDSGMKPATDSDLIPAIPI